ncbi:YecR family lipoprotein [Entomomonas asaccharolytica]|uniref:Lipoprotein n=1 Tax=Entomomonas asaccharolytica TaxID=2785331 RepID=A0A974RW60_9GAMM|nr:YecR family lipoprotein [Entomomonas asaccharolytica]QQP84757.1 hypothetical protein JHT90_10110 [Entomomonas asaccharolytica]
MIKQLLLIMVLGGLTACVTTTVYKDLSVVGTDKAKGQVFMGFDYDSDIIPIVNHERAMREVVIQCQRWSYKSATLKSDYDIKCGEGTEQNCKRYVVAYTYQCLTAEDIEAYEKGNLDLMEEKQTAQ